MNVLIITSFFVVAVSTAYLKEDGIEFQAFKLKHGKIYKNQAEETMRFTIFKENLRAIEQHNALYKQQLVSYQQGITKFADMTHEEFKDWLRLSASRRPHFNSTKHRKSGLQLPNSLDWRTQGCVTEIKDQENCGACWAFSITGSTEGAYARKSGKLVSLSEQQLIDCTTDINSGCDGGYLNKTFPYVQQNGLQSEDSYPFIAKDGNCNYSASDVVAKVSDYKFIDFKDEDALLDAVGNIGPVSVAMDATFLSLYHKGIYIDNKCTPVYLNHAVLIVGYGSDNGTNFWIAKNSWGTAWGEEGFFKVRRGTDECGIAEDAIYPTIAS